MPGLPNTPFTDIEDFRVAVDAPVSTDLMTDIVVDLNYLLGVLTDGAATPQALVEMLNAIFHGDVEILGTLTVNSFEIPETGFMFVTWE